MIFSEAAVTICLETDRGTAAAIARHMGTSDWNLPIYHVGCDQKVIKTSMAYKDQDDLSSQMRLKNEQRKRLLDRVHEEEKR